MRAKYVFLVFISILAGLMLMIESQLYKQDHPWVQQNFDETISIAQQARVSVSAWQHIPSTSPSFRSCLQDTSRKKKWLKTAAEYSRLPRLAIVVTFTSDQVPFGTLSNMQAYAHRHNYAFHAALIRTDEWNKLSDGAKLESFFSIRWHHLQKRFLGKYQWILHLDGDVFALNLHNSLDKYLSIPEDVVLHIREDGELAASAVLLRSTPFSYCFLEEWVRIGTDLNRTRINWDNGDLLDLVGQLVDPPMTDCYPLRTKNYHVKFINCFKDHFDQLSELHHHLPVRILFPMAGFWRTYEGSASPFAGHENLQKRGSYRDLQTRLFYTCAYPSDVLGHQWKEFDSSWTLDIARVMALNDTAYSTLPSCQSLTYADELKLAIDCCFTHYPGCLDNTGSTVHNICHNKLICPENPNLWNEKCDQPINKTTVPELAADFDDVLL